MASSIPIQWPTVVIIRVWSDSFDSLDDPVHPAHTHSIACPIHKGFKTTRKPHTYFIASPIYPRAPSTVYYCMDMSANTPPSSSSIVSESEEGMIIQSFLNLDLYLITPHIPRPNWQPCPKWISAVSTYSRISAEIEGGEIYLVYGRDWLATRWGVRDPPLYYGLSFLREERTDSNSK